MVTLEHYFCPAVGTGRVPKEKVILLRTTSPDRYAVRYLCESCGTENLCFIDPHSALQLLASGVSFEQLAPHEWERQQIDQRIDTPVLTQNLRLPRVPASPPRLLGRKTRTIEWQLRHAAKH